jgi:rhodanese-related sulfurtransferase
MIHDHRRSRVWLFVAAAALSLVSAACGAADSDQEQPAADANPSQEGAIQIVAPTDVNDMLRSDGQRIIIDVRTPEEFAEGHIEGAELIDFYRQDFADELAKLDPDQPYVIYCRSGNRSGQTGEIMAGLGFTDVVDVEGGIVNWQANGLPTVN